MRYFNTLKSYKNILVYNISYKTFAVAKPLCIRFNKTDGFIRVYDGTRYLVFGAEKYDLLDYRIKNLGIKNGITYVVSHNYAKIKVDSYDSLPLDFS